MEQAMCSEAVVVPADFLKVAGITPFTSIDFPGKLSAVAFLQGCPWRCLYCHNAWMQPREFSEHYEHSSWHALYSLLKKRKNLLDGVVFSGGEPTLDPALPEAMKAAKALGFSIGLHTGGGYPRQLQAVLPLVDWIGLDVKAPPTDKTLYDQIVGVKGAGEAFLKSYALIKASGVAFECRTTAHPDFLSEEKMFELAQWLKEEKISHFALQLFQPLKDASVCSLSRVPADFPSETLEKTLKQSVEHFSIRRE